MRRKKLAALLAFGLLAALMVVVTGGSASAATYTAPANAGSQCTFGPAPGTLPDGTDVEESGITFQTDADNYAANSTISIEFGLDTQTNGPVASGPETWFVVYDVNFKYFIQK